MILKLVFNKFSFIKFSHYKYFNFNDIWIWNLWHSNVIYINKDKMQCMTIHTINTHQPYNTQLVDSTPQLFVLIKIHIWPQTESNNNTTFQRSIYRNDRERYISIIGIKSRPRLWYCIDSYSIFLRSIKFGIINICHCVSEHPLRIVLFIVHMKKKMNSTANK